MWAIPPSPEGYSPCLMPYSTISHSQSTTSLPFSHFSTSLLVQTSVLQFYDAQKYHFIPKFPQSTALLSLSCFILLCISHLHTDCTKIASNTKAFVLQILIKYNDRFTALISVKNLSPARADIQRVYYKSRVYGVMWGHPQHVTAIPISQPR